MTPYEEEQMFLFIVLGLKFGIFVLMPWWFGAGDMSHYDDLGIWERVGMAAGDVLGSVAAGVVLDGTDARVVLGNINSRDD